MNSKEEINAQVMDIIQSFIAVHGKEYAQSIVVLLEFAHLTEMFSVRCKDDEAILEFYSIVTKLFWIYSDVACIPKSVSDDLVRHLNLIQDTRYNLGPGAA